MGDFQPLEVVDRGSETQPQVVENFNKFTWQDEVKMLFIYKCVKICYNNLWNVCSQAHSWFPR